MAEIGSTGLNQYQGIIADDFLREWRGQEAYKRANEMRLNSPVVAALLSAIEQSIRKVTWNLTSEEGETDPRIELWDNCARLMEGGFQQFVIEALTCLPFGYALFEIVWCDYEGQTIVAKLAPRGQDTVFRWLLSDTGKLEGFVQSAAPRFNLVEIPIEKLVHLRTRSEKGNPEGRSMLRSAWVPYYYYKNLQQIEAIGIERDLAGLPKIQLPQGANTNESDANSDASKAAKIVRNIRQDEQAGVVLPFGWELELLSTGGSRQFDTDKIITRHESRILMTTLAQFLMLGQQNVGSLALSRDQSDLFVMSVNATADIIADALDAQLIPRLMALNGYDADGLHLTHTPAGDADMTGIADAVVKFTQSGFITVLPEDEVWARQLVGLPEADVEDIQAEKERKIQEQQAAFAKAAQNNPPQGDKAQPDKKAPVNEKNVPEGGENVQQHAADVTDYYTSTRPDAVKRRRFETGLQRQIKAIFQRQRNKIVKAVRANARP